jgi:hypothetical protein
MSTKLTIPPLNLAYAGNWLVIGTIGVGLAWIALRGFRGAAADIVGGAAGAAVNVAEGAVLGVGDAVGIPRTDKTECQKALDEGRYWDASFSCPAGTFLKGWVFGQNGPSSTN